MLQTEPEQIKSYVDYVLPIHGYKRKDAMLQGEGGKPTVYSSIELFVHAPPSFTAHGPAGVVVIMQGPENNYVSINEGETVIGGVYRRNDVLRISMAVTAEYLSNLGTFLSTIGSAPCEISLTVASKLEDWDGKGWLGIYAFSLTTRVENKA